MNLCSLSLLQDKDFDSDAVEATAIPHAGDYHYRSNAGAEKHLNDPAAIAALQEAAQVAPGWGVGVGPCEGCFALFGNGNCGV